MSPGQRGHLAAEIAARPFDSFTQRVTHEAGDLDRCTNLPLAFLKRLRHGFLIVENEALIEQTDLLVESLQTRLDNLVDDVGRLALRFEFFR